VILWIWYWSSRAAKWADGVGGSAVTMQAAGALSRTSVTVAGSIALVRETFRQNATRSTVAAVFFKLTGFSFLCIVCLDQQMPVSCSEGVL
jgi:hypothetical protein